MRCRRHAKVNAVPEQPVAQVRPAQQDSERLARELQLLSERHSWATIEYASLRDESIMAQSNQQAALKWGLAIVSGTIVGGFALSATSQGPTITVQNIQLFLYGLILPALLFAVALVWLGEFARMARVGAYIRQIEKSVISNDGQRSASFNLPTPIAPGWENALAGGDLSVAFAYRRNAAGYAGVGMILAGGQLASGIFWTFYQLEYGLTFWVLPQWALYVSVWLLIVTAIGLEAWFAWATTSLTTPQELMKEGAASVPAQ